MIECGRSSQAILDGSGGPQKLISTSVPAGAYKGWSAYTYVRGGGARRKTNLNHGPLHDELLDAVREALLANLT